MSVNTYFPEALQGQFSTLTYENAPRCPACPDYNFTSHICKIGESICGISDPWTVHETPFRRFIGLCNVCRGIPDLFFLIVPNAFQYPGLRLAPCTEGAPSPYPQGFPTRPGIGSTKMLLNLLGLALQ